MLVRGRKEVFYGCGQRFGLIEMDHVTSLIDGLAFNRTHLFQAFVEFGTRVFSTAAAVMVGMFPFDPKYRCLNFRPRGNGFITPIKNGVHALVRGVGRYVPATVRSKLRPMAREPSPILIIESRTSDSQVVNDILFT